jgi:hypothetical protein
MNVQMSRIGKCSSKSSIKRTSGRSVPDAIDTLSEREVRSDQLNLDFNGMRSLSQTLSPEAGQFGFDLFFAWQRWSGASKRPPAAQRSLSGRRNHFVHAAPSNQVAARLAKRRPTPWFNS